MKPEDLSIIGVECDVSSESSVQKAYAEVLSTFGRVDSVVASAGGSCSTSASNIHLILPPGIVDNYSALE
jgi:NAD(P)-dependent dehydrogenase (short-subunit alcohol dehydrogenase family)